MRHQEILNKRNSDIVKGLAIILMVIHHTFGFPDRIEGVEYSSMIFNLELYIADFGRVCVFMYLFLSGYGLYYTTIKNNGITYKSVLKRALRLLKIYWIVMAIFIPIGILIGVYKFNIKEFIMNLTTISYSYNGEWWFVNTYIILIIIFPLIYKMINNRGILSIGCKSFFIHLMATGIYFISPHIDSIKIIKLLRLVLIYQFYFITGCIFCKYNLFDKISYYFNKKKLNNLVILFMLFILCILTRRISSMLDFIVGPLTIYCSIVIINKLNIDKVFVFMSKHSTNIWLTHSFFCYYYFKKLIFAPKYAVLIILWILILSIGVSYIINALNSINVNKNIIEKNY